MLALVMLGAGLGAAGRWLVESLIAARSASEFPWGTWAVNVVGSLGLGVVLALSAGGHVGEAAVALLGVGVCGGFTTYSTFSFQTVALVESGQTSRAIRYVVASVVVALGAGSLGWFATHTLWN